MNQAERLVLGINRISFLRIAKDLIKVQGIQMPLYILLTLGQSHRSHQLLAFQLEHGHV